MERDPRVANASKAIVTLADECVAGGVEAVAVALEIALGVREFLQGKMPPAAAAALLRECAASIERPDRSAMKASERELLELSDKGLQFIRTLQLAGVDQANAITALTNASVLEFARTRGAAAAAQWLKRLADHTESNAAAIDRAASSL